MPFERRQLEQLLRRLGFAQTEGYHRVFCLTIEGRTVAKTKMSRGTGHRTVGEGIVSDVADELHITRAFLYQLVRGEKGRDDYLNELRRKGLL